jgi:U4/U6.U5 tri-snRNP component SNU23
MADKKGSAYGAPAGDTDFRKSYNLEEAAERAKVREEAEREERKARYEAKLAGKKYHKPLTGNETYTSARRNVLDLTGQIGKTQLVPAGAGVGRRGKGAGFYCETCDMNFKDNLSFVDHINSFEHLQNSGQTSEVRRATAEEVHERIAIWIRKRTELAEEQAKTLTQKLE